MAKKAVLVTTEYRGVFFGYTDAPDGDTVVLTGLRNCLYWSSDVGGFAGLAQIGPTKDCRIGRRLETLVRLRRVTSVADCTPTAERAWNEAPTCGGE